MPARKATEAPGSVQADFPRGNEATTEVPTSAKLRGNEGAADLPFEFTGDGYREIPLEKIVPGKNHRTRFDEKSLAELAASIRERGVDSAITVRPIIGTEGLPVYEIVAGERRYRASILAERLTIPARVRSLSDSDAAIINAVENMLRDDPDSMDMAGAIKTMRDHGLSNADIAQKTGISPGQVSKLSSLLGLPDEVQELLRSGELSPSAAATLKGRFGKFPLALKALAVEAATRGWSVRKLEEAVGWETRSILESAGAARDLRQARFDKTICDTCPHGAKMAWSSGSMCLLPSEFDKKNTAADEVARQKALAVAEASRQQDGAKSSVGKKVTTTEGEPVRLELQTVRDLGHDKCKQIYSEKDRPKGCSEQCPCAGFAYDYSDRVTAVCMDRKRFDRLEKAATREKNKATRQTANADKEAICFLVHWQTPRPTEQVVEGRQLISNAMALIAYHALYYQPMAAKRTIAGWVGCLNTDGTDAGFLVSGSLSPLCDFISAPGHESQKMLGALADWLADAAHGEERRDLLMMAIAKVKALSEIETALANGGTYSTPTDAAYLLGKKSLPGAEKKGEKA